MKLKKTQKISIIVSIFICILFVLFLCFAKQAKVQYMNILGSEEMDSKFSIVSSCIYFVDESSCMWEAPFKGASAKYYITKKATNLLFNNLFDIGIKKERVTIYCYDDYKKRHETLVERNEIACSDEYADIFSNIPENSL